MDFDQQKYARRLLTVDQWSTHHSWPTSSALRHLIFRAHSNGFSKVIRRSGKRILIDENSFFDWVDSGAKQDLAPTEQRANSQETTL